MKIAIVFLIVGLCSSFASCSLLLCIKSMTRDQAIEVVRSYLGIVEDYDYLKAKIADYNKDKTEDEKEEEYSEKWLPLKICIVKAMFRCVVLLAAFKECDRYIVFNELLKCLKLEEKVNIELRICFRDSNYERAARVIVKIKALVEAQCCIMDKIYKGDGLDLLGLINGLIGSPTYVVVGTTTGLLQTLSSLLGVKIINGALFGTIHVVVGVVVSTLGGILDAVVGGLG